MNEIATKQELTQSEQAAAQVLIDAALAEDLNCVGDLTCRALVGADERAQVQVVARDAGCLAGMPIAELLFDKLDGTVHWTEHLSDGARLEAGDVVGTLSGPLGTLLSGERTALNFLTHLSGVATLTRQFVETVADTGAQILDTRKTLPGYRLLQKYAVRVGGGTNHRMGLFDACLIKDNHLAAWSESHPNASIADAILRARSVLPEGTSIEVEVDTLEQLTEALVAAPDMVLLDNMSPALLQKAVTMRDANAPSILLEASGGVTLDTVAEIARTGVERISVGALTHSAPTLDLAFDWKQRIER
jgi:nicotinate-nucleotide pyrophosphorylase (carboxylating)